MKAKPFRPLTVMQLLSSLKHDESERGIYHIAHALTKSGHSSVIISSASDDDELVIRLKRDGSQHHSLAMPKKSWWALRHVFALRRLIKKHKPDVIHVHSRTPAWVLHWALRPIQPERRPHIIGTVYGFYPLNSYAKALFDADLLIAASKSIHRHLVDGLKALSHDGNHPYIPRITCVRRGIDVRTYPYRHHASSHWLQQKFFEFPELEHKKWLIFPTPIAAEHGQEWLIDILGNLIPHYPNLHVIIMDDDPKDSDNKPAPTNLAYEDFHQRTSALKLDQYISYVGKRPSDLKEWLCSADIVLALANFPESIGINVLKAIHLGTPVIGWDKGAFADILHALYPRGLVKQHNALALIKAISSQLKSHSRPAMTHEYEVDTMVGETLALYQQLAWAKTADKS